MDITDRLKQLGIDPTGCEEAVLFAQNKVSEHIKNVCNLERVPDELEYLAIDMACAEFLKDRLPSGLIESFDANGALKKITEGDVTVEYDSSVSQSTVDTLISVLNRGEADLFRFRKICW